MKAVILAGGKGTRLSEETHLIPKPMSELNGMPIIWHIMKIYSYHGIKDFVILAGYKSEKIKDFFINYNFYKSSIEINLKKNSKQLLTKNNTENWNIKIIETGRNSNTGGRILSAKKYIGDSDFCLAYGDCLANIDIKKLITFHKGHNKIATLTAVNPISPYGSLTISGNTVIRFEEKPKYNNKLINGGFFVFKKNIFDYLKNKKTILEKEPLSKLANKKQLKLYFHKGFWHPMDSLRDKRNLQELLDKKKAPWEKFIK